MGLTGFDGKPSSLTGAPSEVYITRKSLYMIVFLHGESNYAMAA